jgi:hypothetical protein
MDGAPAHSPRIVTNYLSPDLFVNDFFLWGHLHDKIYNLVEIQTIEELRQRIIRACQELNPNFIRNAV